MVLIGNLPKQKDICSRVRQWSQSVTGQSWCNVGQLQLTSLLVRL